jgi:hypothetical protein
MAAPQIQPELSPPEGAPAQAIPDWQELQAAGDAAYAAARERERSLGRLDDVAVDLYGQSTENWARAVWWAPSSENLVDRSPITDLHAARAFAKQAEATKPGTFLEGSGSSHIDTKANLQALAVRAEQRGISALLKGRIAELDVAPTQDSTRVRPVVARAAIKAVMTRPGDTVGITPDDLEARGSDGILEFTKVLSEEPDQGLKFIEEITEEIETGIHELPAAPEHEAEAVGSGSH